MIFKERTIEKTIPWNGEKETVRETQCPICGEWFRNHHNNHVNWVKPHITKMAQNESWQREIGVLKKEECIHLIFYKENTIPVGRVIKKNTWKI